MNLWATVPMCHCPEETYGPDCSGMYTCFSSQSIHTHRKVITVFTVKTIDR